MQRLILAALAARSSGPMFRQMLTNYENAFLSSYKHSFYDNNGILKTINTNIEASGDIKLPFNATTKTHLQLTDNTTGAGCSIYPIVDTHIISPTQTIDYFTYAVTPAIYSNQQITNKVQQTSNQVEYLVPTYNGSFKKIDQNEFNILQNKYNSISIRESHSNQLYNIQGLPNNKVHPTNVFHENTEINLFLSDNNVNVNSGNYIYFRHGATYLIQYSGLDMEIHTAILDVGTVNDSPLVRPQFYMNKALDVGRLCPPDC